MSVEEVIGASPAVAAAREGLAGRDAWIAGGAIRDAALGRSVVDVDVAVAGAEEEAARAVAAAAGGPAFPLSQEFGSWRVLGPGGDWHVDISRLRGAGIEEDLGLRDFTVNAMALPLHGGELLDPAGGMRDLEDRVLRSASEAAFEDDPLRVLRAARLAGQLGFAPAPETIELARRSAARVSDPAGERQLAELVALIAGPDPVGGLELLDAMGATAAVLPEVEALRGVEQNPNHHLDVHGHTIEVLRQALGVEERLGEIAGERADDARELLAEPLADGLDRAGALRFAALVHDTGKPVTRGEAGGYITFVGHDREGARIVGEMCERLKTSRRLRRHLQDLTLHHLRLGFLVHERPLPRRSVHDYLRATDPVSADVTLLTVADRLSARGQGGLAAPEMVQAHLDLARDMLAAALDWRRDGPPASPVAGDELAAELDLAPGPEIGRLLREIEAAVYAGEVQGRDEAVALARALRG